MQYLINLGGCHDVVMPYSSSTNRILRRVAGLPAICDMRLLPWKTKNRKYAVVQPLMQFHIGGLSLPSIVGGFCGFDLP